MMFSSERLILSMLRFTIEPTEIKRYGGDRVHLPDLKIANVAFVIQKLSTFARAYRTSIRASSARPQVARRFAFAKWFDLYEVTCRNRSVHPSCYPST